jgi:hypothetical protein
MVREDQVLTSDPSHSPKVDPISSSREHLAFDCLRRAIHAIDGSSDINFIIITLLRDRAVVTLVLRN